MILIKMLCRMLTAIHWRQRRLLYSFYSEISIEGSLPNIKQAQLRSGSGRIICGKGVEFGIWRCRGFWTGLTVFDLRGAGAVVTIGNNVKVNNSLSVTCLDEGLTIGNDVLIGNSVKILGSDFHFIDLAQRYSDARPKSKPVVIHDKVWIGDDVTILKGVSVGAGAVIQSRALVVSDVPANVVVGGVPASVIRGI